MDWIALRLSLELAAITVVVLLPLAFALARLLAYRPFPGSGFVEAAVALPLVLPPTVVGFYLLTLLGAQSVSGRALAAVFGEPLAFSFTGLVVASLIVNVPFAVQPIKNALAAIPPNVRDAARVSGMG